MPQHYIHVWWNLFPGATKIYCCDLRPFWAVRRLTATFPSALPGAPTVCDQPKSLPMRISLTRQQPQKWRSSTIQCLLLATALSSFAFLATLALVSLDRYQCWRRIEQLGARE